MESSVNGKRVGETSSPLPDPVPKYNHETLMTQMNAAVALDSANQFEQLAAKYYRTNPETSRIYVSLYLTQMERAQMYESKTVHLTNVMKQLEEEKRLRLFGRQAKKKGGIFGKLKLEAKELKSKIDNKRIRDGTKVMVAKEVHRNQKLAGLNILRSQVEDRAEMTSEDLQEVVNTLEEKEQMLSKEMTDQLNEKCVELAMRSLPDIETTTPH